MRAVTQHEDRPPYGRWIAACTVAELIGISVAGAVAVAAGQSGDPTTLGGRIAALALFAAVGAVEGGALGFFEWRVLRERLPRLRAGEWVGVTIAIAALGWIAGTVGPVFADSAGETATSAPGPGLLAISLMAAAIGAAAGAVFAAAQWLVLRRHAAHAGRWIAIHVPAWAAAMAAIFLGASLPSDGWPAPLVVLSGAAGGALGGALLGVITAPIACRLVPWVDEHRWSLRGRVCAVTGATSGIGREVALGLARLHGSVVLVCRDPAQGDAISDEIRAAVPGAEVSVVGCDLESIASIRAAAAELLERWSHLDVLVHSAGATYAERALTADGIERTLAVDVAGPFLLTALLRDRIERSAGRVVTLAGIHHRRAQLDVTDLGYAARPFSWLAASNQAQLCRVLVTAELARRAPGLVAVAVHPGAVRTRAQAHLPRFARLLLGTLLRPGFVRAELGALPVVRLCAAPDLAGSGGFVDRFTRVPGGQDARLAGEVWQALEEMTGAATAGETYRNDLDLARAGA